MILYATGKGEVAADGTGKNSPFTTALLQNMSEPGLDFSDLATRVNRSVQTATAGKQRPWFEGSLSKSFYFHPKRLDPLTEEKDWADAKSKDTVEGYRLYTRAYPKGRFVALANDKISRLGDEVRWKAAKAANSIEEYDAYLKFEGNKLHRGEARLAIKRLDDAHWQRARKAHTPADIRAYLSDERHKANREAALAALQKLDDNAWQKASDANSVRAYREYIRSWDDESNDDLDGNYISLAQETHPEVAGELRLVFD